MLDHGMCAKGLSSMLCCKIDPILRRAILRVTLLFASLGMQVAGISSSAWYLNFNRSLDEHAMRYARMHMERFQDAVQRYVMMTAMIESMLRDMGGDASRFPRLARYLAEGDSGILLLKYFRLNMVDEALEQEMA